MCLLSIIVPVYNAEKWLCEALNSLVLQTWDSLEIICVDDGSVDDSRNIILSVYSFVIKDRICPGNVLLLF